MKLKSNLEHRFHQWFPTLPYEPVRLQYQKTCHYTPDFQVSETHFIEVKGLFTAQDRSKHLHIKQQHPNIKVTFVFQDPRRRLSKTSRTTYADWCLKHGFEYHAISELKLLNLSTGKNGS